MKDEKFMKELLDGVEVQWKTLGEVAGFKNGFAFKSNLFKEEGLPIIRITNINGNNINLSNGVYFNQLDNKENIKNYEVNKGDILVAMSGATTGKFELILCFLFTFLTFSMSLSCASILSISLSI